MHARAEGAATAEFPRDRLLRVDDLARVVGLSRATIYRLIVAGRAPKVVRLPRRGVRFRPRDVERWLRDRTET